jgi:hypothetical protein
MFKQIYFTVLYCVNSVPGSVIVFRDFRVSRQGKAMHTEGHETHTTVLTLFLTRKNIIYVRFPDCFTHIGVMY